MESTNPGAGRPARFPAVTYIFHDGFFAECEDCCLLFDYWRGEMPRIPQDKPLFVFSSHVHQDHFSFRIFLLAQAHPNATFLLSNDIHRKFNRRAFEKQITALGVPAEMYERIRFLKAGEEYRFGLADGQPYGTDDQPAGGTDGQTAGKGAPYLTVHTIKSTDQGCAFLTDTGKELLYHAGDLNDWSWPENTDEVNRTERSDYHREMGRLAEILEKKASVRPDRTAPLIDTAFLPLDPKQEQFCGAGFDFFMRNVGAKEAWPMHCWERYDVIDRFLADPVSEPYRERVRRPASGTA